MPLFIRSTIKDLNEAEDYLLKKDAAEFKDKMIETVIVRPCGLSNKEGSGEYDLRIATDLDMPKKYKNGPMIPRSDVALVMTNLIKDNSLFAKHVDNPVSVLAPNLKVDEVTCSKGFFSRFFGA